ncbi:hypothetical protein [Butyrivibrio sp. MC2021]|uniref:hypothetical protein n=1 Tax=Butyrivibrio sp. MC2021 TaxID=1408306 RepID=UPI00047C4B56|nr:hypothetical protein [Butyrivibrio sp. MC2021]
MDGEKNQSILDKKYKWIYGGMFFLTGILVLIVSAIHGRSYEIILRNTVSAFIIGGTVVFMLVDAISRGKEALSYDNYNYKLPFVICYLAALILSVAFSFVPNLFWPYMAIFVMLALFSNSEIGLISGTGLLLISVMLEESGSYGEVFMYLLAGAVAIAMFRDLKETTAIGAPMSISLMMQAVLLIAYNVLFQNRTLSFNLLAIPVLNLMLNVIILLIFLNMFGVYVIRKTNDRYMDINDPEFPLLVSLKEKDKDEYYRAIHTAYLSERVAHELGLNSRAVKTCAYYHRIGILEDKTKWKDVEHLYTENNFPLEAVEYLHEYIQPEKGKPRSKEALTVQLCETVIASIMLLIKKNKNATINYEDLIEGIFKKKTDAGELKDYDVTFREYETIRRILKREKLYYDFLR